MSSVHTNGAEPCTSSAAATAAARLPSEAADEPLQAAAAAPRPTLIEWHDEAEYIGGDDVDDEDEDDDADNLPYPGFVADHLVDNRELADLQICRQVAWLLRTNARATLVGVECGHESLVCERASVNLVKLASLRPLCLKVRSSHNDRHPHQLCYSRHVRCTINDTRKN